MERVESFTIDHTKLMPGLYHRGEKAGVSTWDLRIKRPNTDFLSNACLHTVEHIMADYFRSQSDDMIYIGPMGCQTGFYVLTINMDYKAMEALFAKFLTEGIYEYRGTIMPGYSEYTCGNYKNLNAEEAIKEMEIFAEQWFDSKEVKNHE